MIENFWVRWEVMGLIDDVRAWAREQLGQIPSEIEDDAHALMDSDESEQYGYAMALRELLMFLDEMGDQ